MVCIITTCGRLPEASFGIDTIAGAATKKPHTVPIHAHGASVSVRPAAQVGNNTHRAEWTTDFSVATGFLPPTAVKAIAEVTFFANCRRFIKDILEFIGVS